MFSGRDREDSFQRSLVSNLTKEGLMSPLSDADLPMVDTSTVKVPTSPSTTAPTIPASPATVAPTFSDVDAGSFNSASGKIQTTHNGDLLVPYFDFRSGAAALVEDEDECTLSSAVAPVTTVTVNTNDSRNKIESPDSETVVLEVKPYPERDVAITRGVAEGRGKRPQNSPASPRVKAVTTMDRPPASEVNPWNELDDDAYLVGYSPKGTTVCGVCGHKVAKGKLQMGIFYAHKHKFTLVKWHHLHCILPPTCFTCPMDLCGFEDIRGEDVDTVQRWLGFESDGVARDRANTL
ncbi:unnamed protein product [Choristocarpus tenellus]